MSDPEKPDLAERYTSAVGTSNLRVQAERSSPADMVIAAGMNEARLGMSLRRLATEWDAVGKPPRPSQQNLQAMAAKYPREKSGLVLHDGKEVTPAVAAQREADTWYAHELGLLFQRLKTLPEVRNALVQWSKEKNIEGPEHVVGAVLQWWLSPICPVCKGVKKKIIAGTGRTGSKDCSECKGYGEKPLPHGGQGRMVRDHIRRCLNTSVAGLRKRFSRP